MRLAFFFFSLLLFFGLAMAIVMDCCTGPKLSNFDDYFLYIPKCMLKGLVPEALSLFTLFLFFGGLKEAGELPL